MENKNMNTMIHPFPGLRPFEEDEEHLFFGREKPVVELLSRLRTSRFVAVIGTSGSGKSSLIKAGLLPSLYRGFMAQAGSSWRVAVFRPGDNPIGNLAHALSKNLLLFQGSVENSDDDPEQVEMRRKMMETTLRRSNRGLIEIVKEARLPGHENLLIVVDQFEELFRFSKLERSQQEERLDSAAFVNLLLESAAQTTFPIYIILTMRSDFLGDCTEFRGLPEAINRGQYLIPRMTRNEKRDAIAGPIAVGSAEITPTLLSRVLNDVGNNPDQLPILQHALMRTWDYWLENRKDREPLDLVHYEAIGTMERALAKHAEEAYRELKTQKNQIICEKMFKLLTDRGETGRGVRRPARVSEISAVTGASEKEVIHVINVFRQPGRTFLMPPHDVSLHADSIIDISHESLMRIWERLIQWVKEEEQAAETYIRLAQAAALNEEGKTGLYRDPELLLALNWWEENKPNKVWADRYDSTFYRATRFLVASKKQKDFEIKEKERQQKVKIRTARIATAIFGVLFIISSYLAFWAYEKQIEAEFAQLYAQLEKDEANRQKKEADEKRKEAERLRKELKEETDKALEAIKKQNKAEKTATENELKKIKAQKNELKKTIQKLIADMNDYKSRFGEYLSKAKELAVHSINQNKDKELKALLALTAYDINNKAYDDLKNDTEKKRIEFEGLKADKNPDEAKEMEELEEAKKFDKKYKELQESVKNKRQPHDIFEAVRRAYITKEISKDIIYPNAESWALAADDNNTIIFNDRDGQLFMTSLQPQPGDDSKLPGINKNLKPVLTHFVVHANCFARANKDNSLFCGTKDGRIIHWKKDRWKDTKQLVNHNATILSLAFSKHKNSLIYSVKNTIYIHNLVDKAKPDKLIPFKREKFIRTLTVIEDSVHSFLITADSNGNIFQVDLLSEKMEIEPLKTDYKPDGLEVHAMEYNPDSKMLALVNSGGEIYLFSDIDCKRLISHKKIHCDKFEKGHKGIVRALTISPDGRYLATGGLDGTIMLWDLIDKKADEIRRQSPILIITGNLKILSIVFVSKGKYLIFNDEKNLRICPTSPQPFYEKLCKRKKRPMSPEEWNLFIGESIKRENIIICPLKKGKKK